MNILIILYSIIIKPLIFAFDTIFAISYRLTNKVGVSIIILSIIVNLIILPLYNRADEIQAEESEKKNKLKKWEEHIKKHFKGDERFMILQTYYRQNDYKPYYSLRSAISLLLQIPFFIAAYRFLSDLSLLYDVSFGPIKDLSSPDGLLVISGIAINLLPIIMTIINIVSGLLYSRAVCLKDRIQMIVVALVFLVLLYNSPSGLVFYWTCNNIFSLVKNIVYKLLSSRSKKETNDISKKSIDNNKLTIIFISAALLDALMLGLYIPGSLISSARDEFIRVNTLVNPTFYVLNCFCVAFGLCFVWVGVFFSLSKHRGKVIIADFMFIGFVLGMINFITITFNGQMHQFLTFDSPLTKSPSEMLKNTVVALSVIVLCCILVRYKTNIISTILLYAMMAFAIINTWSAIKLYSSSADKIDRIKSHYTEPQIHLSKDGQNVVVIMMDRMVGQLIPYIMTEKPELKESFDGFTFYPNSVSFGSATNEGTPGLYGGYEYIPWETNKNPNVSLKDKQNEALKVMPVLFDQNGYDVAVGDPKYANYEWIPDLSIYDEYPDIYSFISKGSLTPEDAPYTFDKVMDRNLLFYSIFRASPSILQKKIYDGGKYLSVDTSFSDGIGVCTLINDSKSAGISEEFYDAYTVLNALPYISKIDEGNKGNFTIFSNDTTHEANLLQEPDYSLSLYVDNEEYDKNNLGRYSETGDYLDIHEKEYKVSETDGVIQNEQIMRLISYHSNMAAMLKLGEWFDYLKQEGVYDNTRIIIVSDHSCSLGLQDDLLCMLTFEDGTKSWYDMLSFQSTLLVKDFNSTGFTTDNTFMTNADVPTIATEGLIDDPKNPFTGKSINSNYKNEEELKLVQVGEWNVQNNHGNTYSAGQWFTVKDNIFDVNNWKYLGEQ